MNKQKTNFPVKLFVAVANAKVCSLWNLILLYVLVWCCIFLLQVLVFNLGFTLEFWDAYADKMMYISSLSDEWCRLAHKFLYQSPWHVHAIVLTNQLSRFLTKRYISVANAIWCDLQWCGRMKTVEKYWKSQAIIYEFTKFTRASLYAKPSNWQDFNEVNEFCDIFWQIYLSLYLSLSFSRFLQYLFLFSTLTRSLSHPHPSSPTQNTPIRFYVRKEAFKLHTFNCIASNFILLKFPPKQKRTHVSNK